jgi:death-on-curing protein
LAEHGGIDGIRDAGLLESALARPRNLWAYADRKPDLADLAASYAFGVVQNHPFLDGNKRTGYVLLRMFLLINGHDIEVPPEEKYQTLLSVANGTLAETDLAIWIRRRLRRLECR